MQKFSETDWAYITRLERENEALRSAVKVLEQEFKNRPEKKWNYYEGIYL